MSECGWFGAIHDCGLGFSLATSYSGVQNYLLRFTRKHLVYALMDVS